MKKLFLVSVAAFALTGAAAQAQLVIQPTIVQPAPVPYYAAPGPVYAEPYGYHGRWDRHHRYDWNYWHDHGHDEHGRR